MAKNLSEPTGTNPAIYPVNKGKTARGRRITRNGNFRAVSSTASAQRELRLLDARSKKNMTALSEMPDIAIALEGSRDQDVLPVAIFGDGTTDIEVTCTPWQAGDDTADLVWLRVRSQPLDNIIYDGYQSGDQERLEDLGNPLALNLPMTVLTTPDGQDEFFTLQFIQGSDFSDEYVSLAYRFEVDRRKPGGDSLVHPLIDTKFIRNGLNLNDLDANGGKLDVTVDPYDDMQPGDTVQAFIQVAGSTTPVPSAPHVITYDGEVTTLELLKDDLLAGAIDGKVELWLTSTDIAGNSAASPKIEFDTLLANSPSNFGPISMPAHDDNGDLLNDERARSGPRYTVPGYDNASATDVIEVVIALPNGSAQFVDRIPVVDPTANPIVEETMTYADLDAVRAAMGGGSVFSFDMTYAVIRGQFRIDPGQVKTINCDLTLAGGDDPDPETPIHENLLPPTIAGDNEVDETEFDSPVATSIPRLAFDGTAVFELNDAVQLYTTELGGANPSPVGPPVAVTDPAVDLTTIEVPANLLTVGTMYFQYSISRAVSGGESNVAWSPIQAVLVKSADDLPGGDQPLPLTKYIFRDADQTRGTPRRPSYSYSRCGDLDVAGRPNPYAGALLRIHQYLNMAVGDVIEVKVEGSPDYPNYVAPGPDATFVYPHTVTPADMQPRQTAIPEDTLVGSEPPPNEPDIFVDFVMSYEDIEKIKRGTVSAMGTMRVSYTVTSASGGSNSSDPADVLFASVDARRPS